MPAGIWDNIATSWEMACPTCEAGGTYLEVEAKVWVRLVVDGTDADLASVNDHEWNNESPCQCSDCGWTGTVADAKKYFCDNTETDGLAKPQVMYVGPCDRWNGKIGAVMSVDSDGWTIVDFGSGDPAKCAAAHLVNPDPNHPSNRGFDGPTGAE